MKKLQNAAEKTNTTPKMKTQQATTQRAAIHEPLAKTPKAAIKLQTASKA